MHGVNADAVEDDLVVQVRPGAAAGVAHIAHQIAPAQGIAFFNRAALHMGIPGYQPIAVIDDYGIAVGTVRAGEADHALGCALDGRASLGGNVYAFVELAPTGERRAAAAEV